MSIGAWTTSCVQKIWFGNVENNLRKSRSKVTDLKPSVWADDYLHPERGPFTYLWHFDYYEAVCQILGLRDLEYYDVISVVCLPTFSPEWALRIVGSGELGYRLVLTEASERIRRARDRSSVQANRFEISVEPEFAVKATDFWDAMLFRARHPTEYLSLGDGTMYHFTSNGLAAYTHSPRPETQPGRLVLICERMAELARTGASHVDELLRAIEAALRAVSE